MDCTDIKIIQVIVKELYKIEVEFNDKHKKTIDLEPVLFGSLYGQLRNPELFKKVKINSEVATVEWPNGGDFHPETLYNWSIYKYDLAEKAKKWTI